MNTQRFKKIEKIFHAALEIKPHNRDAFLREHCKDDDALRKEVSALVTAHQQAGTFLEAPNLPLLIPDLRDSAPDPMLGKQIGAFRIQRCIAEGGMGKVYLGSRDDKAFKQQVAIKLIKRGMDTDEVLKRFRYERQTLAGLVHPNIARLLDGGRTKDGLPYLVMEFIDGIPIDDYCDENKLSTAQRLQLFRTVCAAVHFAHQNLIVHRDLKPANILVTVDGQPKLLDFGIAKLLNHGLTGQTLNLTRTGMRFMSPEYASPEQIRGQTITTATDIYSLGVLLYKLLTGHHPYRFTTHQPSEIEKVICETEPLKPSTVISRTVEITASDGTKTTLTPETVSQTRDGKVDKLQRNLSGDIDNIIMMALRKEAQRRYLSVEQFSEDILRHLNGLPVIAHKQSLAYRSAKFIKRHATAVTVAGLFLILLIGSITSVMWQAKIAANQRDKAQLEAAKSKQITKFLQEMLASADPNIHAKDITVAEILNIASDRLKKELNDQPEIAATLHLTLGNTYTSLGIYDKAEQHLRTALKIERKRPTDATPEIANVLNRLGLLMTQKGDYRASENYLRDAVRMYRGLADKDSLGLASALDGLGVLLNKIGQYSESEQMYREALLIDRRCLNDTLDARIGRLLNNLGVLLGSEGDFADAEPLHREALQIMRHVYGEEHPEVAYTLYNLGGVLDAEGDYEHSLPLFKKALNLRLKLLGREHPLIVFNMCTISSTYWYMKKFQQAILYGRKALVLAKKVLPKVHPLTAYAEMVLGQALSGSGQAQKGETHLQAAFEMRKNIYPENHPLVANAESVLGACLVEQRRYSEAEPLLLESYANLKASRGEKHEKTVAALKRLKKLYADWGKPEKAAKIRTQLSDVDD